MKGKHVVLGVTGGISAYKAADLTSKLVQAGAEVTVVMTESAARFVTPLTFETLSRRQVHTEMWHAEGEFSSSHLALSEWADVVLVAPATANIIAKLAHGIADDLLSTMLLAVDSPVVLAPAMNERMWKNPVVRDNVRRLKELGYHVVGPGEGYLACGVVGMGRLADVKDILDVVASLLK
jgi:phosphopantothenoylcysteine decarboxylase/phosphopantothenate--cysteine ligase